MKLRDVPAFIGATLGLNRTQHDITSAALHHKRQLEAFGLFPGLRPGTPRRLHKNVEDGKTRGERKREARALANGRVRAWIDALPTSQHARPRPVRKEPPLKAVFDEGLSILDESYSLKTRYEVVGDGPFMVASTQPGATQHGPYGRRSTANRRARQLNGE